MPEFGLYKLLAVDTSGIQDYIFGSNRLIENIGASFLVQQVTEQWALNTLIEANIVCNASQSLINKDRYVLDDAQKIEEGHLMAEVLYMGGGNFVALFRDQEAAKVFTRQLSQKVLLEAPGLRLDIFQKDFHWNNNLPLGKAVAQLLTEMKKKRAVKPSSAPLLGLSVTAACTSTGLPAVAMGDRDLYVSAEIAAKQGFKDSANRRLRRELPPGDSYVYPLDFDNFGRERGDSSFLALVHADGNGMGAIIRTIGSIEDNREYISQMRAFSEAVKKISQSAMSEVLKTLVANIEIEESKHKADEYYIRGRGVVSNIVLNDKYLPFRPLVFGGDDTTFVCEGRIGLSLAVKYLEAFEQAAHNYAHPNAAVEGKLHELTACAGVAIFKAHYPFARAYALAEELCNSAKKARFSTFNESDSALDWYFALNGVSADLDEMRKREYETEWGELTLRPVVVNIESRDDHRTWRHVAKQIAAFQKTNEDKDWGNLITHTSNGYDAAFQKTDKDKDWGNSRNKAKLLREVIRDGSEAVARFVSVYPNPELPQGGFPDGWHEGYRRADYFDALELMDLHIALDDAKQTDQEERK